MSCPPLTEIRRLVEDGLATDEASLSEHLDRCTSCRAILEQLEQQADAPDLLRFGRESPRDVSAVNELKTLGPYRILGLAGTGAFGVVYRSQHRVTQKLVALKVFHGTVTHPLAARRLQREARAAGAIDHPHVVKILDAGVLENHCFCAFEWLPGGDLTQFLGSTATPIRMAAEMARGIAWGTAALHSAGIIHRDLKPGNIVLTADKRPKVTDFSVAKLIQSAPGASSFAQTVGTPEFMAPEQLGYGGRAVSTATDIYGIGAVLYALLTGRAPFVGDNAAATLHRICHAPLIPPRSLRPDIPRDLETICLKCLDRDPHHRYSTATAVADDLDRFVNLRSITARRPPFWRSSWRWCRRQPVLATLLLLLCVVMATTIALLSSAARQQKREIARNIIRSMMVAEPGHVSELVRQSDQIAESVWLEEVERALGRTPSRGRGRSRLLLLDPSRWTGPEGQLDRLPEFESPHEVAVAVERLRKSSPDVRSRILHGIDSIDPTPTRPYQCLAIAVLMAPYEGAAAYFNRHGDDIVRSLLALPWIQTVDWAGELEAGGEHLTEPLLRMLGDNRELTPPKRETCRLLAWNWSRANEATMAKILFLSPAGSVGKLLEGARAAGSVEAMTPGTPHTATAEHADAKHHASVDFADLRCQVRDEYDRLSAGLRGARHKGRSPPPEAIDKLARQVAGVASAEAAVLPLIPPDQWSRILATLVAHGYTPRSVRRAGPAANSVVAAAFDQCQEPTEIDFDVRIEALAELAESRGRGGWQPVSVAPWMAQTPLDDRDHRLAVVWRKARSFRSKIYWCDERPESSDVTLGQTYRWEHWVRVRGSARDEDCVGWLCWARAANATVNTPGWPAVRQHVCLPDAVTNLFQAEWDVTLHSPLRPVWIFPVDAAEHAAIASRHLRAGFTPWEVIAGDAVDGPGFAHNAAAAIDAPQSSQGSMGVLGHSVGARPARPRVASYWVASSPSPTLEQVQSRAHAAYLCWLLDDHEPLVEVLDELEDPSVATDLISRMAQAPDRLTQHWNELLQQGSSRVVRAHLLAVGQRPTDELSSLLTPERWEVVETLATEHPDAGVHSAAEWLLRRGHHPIPPKRVPPHPSSLPHGTWYRSPDGMLLSVIDAPGYHLFGADDSVLWIPDRQRYFKRPRFAFAISATEVTNAQFEKFFQSVGGIDASTGLPQSPYADGPVTMVSYWTALKYCRWLSEQEGIPENEMCLPPIDQIGPGLEFTEERLSRSGYRLPTELEWELACRAGTVTPRHFGRDLNQLENYAWTPREGSGFAHPVGLQMPNAWGLFDCLGNVYELCLTPSGASERRYEETRTGEPLLQFRIEEADAIAVRGGSFLSHVQYCTAGANHRQPPHTRDANIGFRVCRTLRPCH